MTRKTPNEKSYGSGYLSLSPGLFLSSGLRNGKLVKKYYNIRIISVSLLNEVHLILVDK